MKKRCALVVAAMLVGAVVAQDEARRLATHVRDGGWFEASKFQRGDDGALQFHMFAHTGDPNLAQWVPVFAIDGERAALHNLGAMGLLALFCHGDGDLLAMTDSDFHFGALGVPTTDVDLRQRLAVGAVDFTGPKGRAELLDRLLIVDRLAARGVRSAVGELTMLAKDEGSPAVLRERAAAAVATLRGQPSPIGRRRLDPQVVQLPAAFDGCVVVDHARLPDLRWLTACARRVGALVTAARVEAAGGSISPAMLNGAQRLCDMPAEAPFWLAMAFGNARLDHSLVTVSARADANLPVAIGWNAVGAFEPDGWAKAELPAGAARNNPLFGGTLAVAATSLYASTDGSRGKPRPAMAEKLLLDDGAAVKAIVPANSKLWPALAFLQLPPAEGAELRVVFGEPAVLVLAVTARDEDAAEAWVVKGKELLAAAKPWAEQLPAAIAGLPETRLLVDALLAASLGSKDDTAFATVEVRGFTAAKLRTIVETWAGRPL